MSKVTTIDYLFYRKLGTELNDLRKERNLSLRELSKKTGYSRTLIDNWELGIQRIKPEQLERLCKVLEVSNNLKIDVKLGFWRG